MAKGILHLHLTVVILFLLFMIFKTILLLANKTVLLDKIREKTKVLDIILGSLILVTGGYLLFALHSDKIDTYLIGKIILVLAGIPLGIVGIKKKNKVLAVLSVLIFLFTYRVGETHSLTGAREKISATDAELIYTQNCANCHGADGKLGLSGAKDLSQSTLNTSEKESVIANGKGIMPKFKGQLNDQQIKDLTNYIEGFKK
ncbi:MAG: SirB2 family protein [Cytophagaceae bacterium]